MGKRTDLTGLTFGRWTVLYREDVPSNDGRKKYVCSCECGTERKVDGRRLTNGTSVSCGCYVIETVKERFTTHGMSSSPTYQSWAGMKQRCDNPNQTGYHDYGGRGISYSEDWKEFSAFLKDMGECPDGLSLDRIDVNGNYSKENCRWSTDNTQSHGRRKLVYKNTTKPGRFIGVVWRKSARAWRVKLVYNYKAVFDRQFSDDVLAAVVYDHVSSMYYGDKPNQRHLESLGFSVEDQENILSVFKNKEKQCN